MKDLKANNIFRESPASLAKKKAICEANNVGALIHNGTLYVRDTDTRLKKVRWVKSCLTSSVISL